MTNQGKQVWVSPHQNGKWRVYVAWSQTDYAHKDTKEEAIRTARELARSLWAELKVQNKDGTISISDSHGRDPFPPRW